MILRLPSAGPAIGADPAPVFTPVRFAGGDGVWSAPAVSKKEAVIAGLRSRILSLERHAPPSDSSLVTGNAGTPRTHRPRWDLGCEPFDALLPKGLEANSVHEIKGAASALGGASAADWLAGIGFAARLAVRRAEVLMAARTGASSSSVQPWVLWCWPRPLANELGIASAVGLAQLGLDPARLLIVETARAGEALNALEEGLKASSLGLVIGVLDEVDLTPARRLSLAAAETGTPCLLVTHPASAPTGATATRWRVARMASGPHRFDPRAPGAARFSAAIERCRARPESTALPPLHLEWCHETRRFGLAAVVADLPAQTRRAYGGAFGAAVRAG